MNETYQINQLNQLKLVVKHLSTQINRGVIYLNGDLGTGKTTFVSLWLKTLGVNEKITSPTYSLVNTYQVGKIEILHSDLYRLSDPSELLYIGVDDWDGSNQLLFIEWPEKGKGYLPDPDYIADFSLENKRILKFYSNL